MKLDKKVWLFTLCMIFELSWAAAQTMPSAPATPTPMAASAATAVPPMIPYSGTALDSRGNALTGEKIVTFLIYKGEQGGEPLFAETQTVTPDRAGQYRVQLGASLSNGIPIDLFASGEARWLEVQIAGEQPQPRVLLVSVPYALKAADSATLGGLPPSAFVLAGANVSTAAAITPAIAPDATSTVTTTGGTPNRLAKFSGSNTIVNSTLFDNGTEVGIGTITPTATLEVNGTMTVAGDSTYHGALVLPALGSATASTAFSSQLIKIYASAYNSSTKAVVPPHFEWQAAATGNNTAAPSATLNLLSSTTSAGATKTGFSFNANGTMNFASGQTFPGTGKITSVALSAPSSDFKVTGSPITGSGTLGLNWTVAPTNAATANAIVKRDANGSFIAGAITANLGMEGVSTGGNGVYGQGNVGVWGQSVGTNGGSDGVHGVTSSAGASGVAGVNNAGGVGVYGTGGTGVFGTGSNYGMVTDSNVQQARTAGGWVKAMAEVNPFFSTPSIDACFNSTLAGAAATTPPCGISLAEIQTGIFTLTFNFEVDDRFYSTQLIDAFGTYLQLLKDGSSTLETATWDFSGNLKAAEYQLIVY